MRKKFSILFPQRDVHIYHQNSPDKLVASSD